MPLPKLSPLQSRLAASLMASVMLLLLYFAFSLPHFAYAADVDSIRPEDHNHERLLDVPFLIDYDELELRDMTYEAQFVGIDRGIIGRQTIEPTALINNRMDLTNIQQGQLVSYMFTNASLWADKSPVPPGFPSQIPLQEQDLNGTRKRRDLEEDLDVEEDVEEDEDGIEKLTLNPRQSNSADQRTLYITVTACDQPISNISADPAAQLQLYVSQSPNNTSPGPGQDSNLQETVELTEGYVLHEVNATGDVFIGVYAKNNTAYSGVYSAQIAVSIDAPFHQYWNRTDPNLFLVDSDDSSALLFTNPFMTNSSDVTLRSAWMDQTPPYSIFVSDADDKSILGLQRSYCGLQNRAQIQASRPGQIVSNIVTGMTTVGHGSLPKQQFYVNGLAAGKSYNVALGMNGNSTNAGDGVVGGGGQIFRLTSFNTLQDGNCAVIYDLSFCDQTAYSVPSNPNIFPNMSALAAFFDNSTQATYANFEKVLAQIPCETTSSAQYSLARNCTECAASYKAWLCAVSIPRCTDFTSTKDWLQSRAMGQPFPNGTFLEQDILKSANQTTAINGSRSARIDQVLMPGPYKEILPCDELCYNLVQSCPASMGFNCPQPGDIGFNESYGIKPIGGGDADGRIWNITCNYPGMVYYTSAGSRALPSLMFVTVGVIAGLMSV